MQPGDADPVADAKRPAPGAERVDGPDDLVTGGDRQERELEVALDDVQVGPAAPARRHATRTSPGPGSGGGRSTSSSGRGSPTGPRARSTWRARHGTTNVAGP